MVELSTILSRLNGERGQDFEQAVKTAFDFLGFECEWKGENEASPDVIVKASLADKPFVSIFECCAVEERNEVGHGKVSQLRDYFPTYQVEYGRQGWALVYPVLVGRPAFSAPCRRYADVGDASSPSHTKIRLISADVVSDILRKHAQFQFTQNELRPIFGFDQSIESVQLSTYDLNNIYGPLIKKVRLYALIFMALVDNPIGEDFDPRTEWVSIDELLGTINMLSLIAYKARFSREQIREAARDLSSPVVKSVELGFRDGQILVKRSSLSNQSFVESMGRLQKAFWTESFHIMERLSQRSESE